MSSNRDSSKVKKTAAVIGSGFGGLAVAIRLQSQGFQVKIFEKREMPGGRAYVYREGGFTFDAGPTVITAPETLSELFEINNKKIENYVELMPVDPFYKLCWEDGKTFNYNGDLEQTLAEIRRFNPADIEGYKKFLAYSKEVYQQGYVKLADKAFLTVASMLKTAPQLLRLRADRSVYSAVSRFIENEHLRQAFSFHSLLVGGNPFGTSSIYTLIHYLERNGGVFFPRGGTGALVQALAKLFKEIGGTIELNAEVSKITTSRGTVTGVLKQNGESEKFDLVVSNGDVVHTYRKLLSDENLVEKTASRVGRMRHSMGLFLIYFGTRREFPQVAHHNVLFGPRYKELLKDIFSRGHLPDDFSLYLHAPTRTDKSLAPPGHECFYVLSPVSHLGKLNVDWSVEGPRYADKILKYLDERYLPGLLDSLVYKKIFTPTDFKQELNAHWGSAFSLEPILTQSAYFRTHNKDSKLKGLYFVGAGTHPGAGVPGVVASAKATARVVAADFGVPL
ncbi:MAG: phytoene desaturase [Bdellovibrionales bacterium CG10_big_fil_rev_8_21_14_0_10_45_34]|nr:MAG: phytoene desaturase [Bdellovibrionales bacterium CG10_big_fil_rev_8_21_14_0_10_45_34]